MLGDDRGQRGPDDLLDFGRDRRPARRWRSRSVLAGLVLVTLLVVGVRTGFFAGSGHAAHQSPKHTSADDGNGPPRLRVILTGRHLLKVSGNWELLARGLDELVRIQLAKGRITETYVPPLQTSNPTVAFVATKHETIIRPADFVPGYIVPDGERAQLLTGPLAVGGPLVPGAAGSETAWIPTGSQASSGLSLIELTGQRTGPVIKFRPGGPQLPSTATSDGRGNVLVASSSFTAYDAGPTSDRPVPGTIIAVGPAGWLTVVCEAKSQHCRNEVINSKSGARRVLPGATRPQPYFFTWPPAGVIAPDGRMAAVVGRVVAGRGLGPANAVHLVNLRTGVTRDLSVRVGGPGGFPLGTSTATESMAWSPDSRWLFIAAVGGKLLAIDTRSDRNVSLGVNLPPVEQVVVRP